MGILPRQAIRTAWVTITDPVGAQRLRRERTLEQTLGLYLVLLVWNGILAGAFSFIYAFIRAMYLAQVHGVIIDYWRLTNYFSQIAVGTFFFTIFAGTFLFFIASVIIHRFGRGVAYTTIIGTLCAALSPILLFGWISPIASAALGLWSLVILVSAMKAERGTQAQESTPPRKAQRKKK